MVVKIEPINTLEEATALLQAIEAAGGDETWPDHIEFGDAFAKIEIDIEGKNYHSSVPAELARALWEYQEVLYKASAFALYGVEDGRRLTREQRDQLELVFEVREGSTGLIASLKDFMAALAKGFETMDSKHKAYTLTAIVIVLSIGYGAGLLIESSKQVKIEETKAGQATALEIEKTKQFSIIAQAAGSNDVVDKFSKASEKGARAIVESASDADKIRVGKTTLNKSEIEDLNQRAARDKATASIISESFTLLRVEPRESSLTKFLLQRSDGTEFAAILQDDDLAPDDVQRIWEAARSRKSIHLEINATMMRGAIKSATILRAIDSARQQVAKR